MTTAHPINRKVGRCLAALWVICILSGCSTLEWGPSPEGAKNNCATNSANLGQYNECVEHVETFHEDLERQQQMDENNSH